MKRLSSFGLLLSSALLASCGGGGESSTTTTTTSSSVPPTSRVNDFYRAISQHLRLDQTETIFGSVLTQYNYNTFPTKDLDITITPSLITTKFIYENGEYDEIDFDFDDIVSTDITGYRIYRDRSLKDNFFSDHLVAMQNGSRQTDYTAYGTWASVKYNSTYPSDPYEIGAVAWADGTGYYEGGRSPQDNGLTSATYTYRGDSVGKLFAIFSNDVTVYGNYEADVMLQYNGSSDSISGCVGCNKGQFIDVASNSPEAERQWTIDPRLAVKFDFPSTRLDGNQFTTTNLNVTPAIPEVTSTSGFTGELSGQFSDDSEGVIGTYSTQGTVRYANGLTVTGGAIGSFATEKE